MYDSYGDGWNGASIDIFVNGNKVIAAATIGSGSVGVGAFKAAIGDVVTWSFTSGSYDSEITWDISGAGVVLVQSNNPHASEGSFTVPTP